MMLTLTYDNDTNEPPNIYLKTLNVTSFENYHPLD